MKKAWYFLGAAVLCAFILNPYSAISKAETQAVSDSSIEAAKPQPQDSTFSYVHDPRTNPKAMEDIIENSDAVYGFSPDPESERLGPYADYDWTDPEFVASAQKERRAYHESMDSMTDILYRMREEGASMEEMARAVSDERNRLRLES
ncbi:MAG: hypothetical protein IKE58_02440 [Blautia sp.]|nr:hypothetical protein [Blautia sp.]